MKNLAAINKKYILLFVPAILLLGWLAWYFSDKQVIKRQLLELSWDVSKEEEESTMEMALKMREIKLQLSEKNIVVIPERNFNETVEEDLIIQYLMYYRKRYETMTVSFENMLITLPEKGKAEVTTTVFLDRKEPQHEPTQLQAPVDLFLKKNEKDSGRDWLLYKAKVPEILVE